LYAGDVFTVYVLGNPMIVLDSIEATTDLLEKRSGNYSDRPDMPMIKDLCVFLGSHSGLATMQFYAGWDGLGPLL
jgi:hypothetical protein